MAEIFHRVSAHLHKIVLEVMDATNFADIHRSTSADRTEPADLRILDNSNPITLLCSNRKTF
jgi:hypothetical protein